MEQTAADFRAYLDLAPEYTVDGVLAYGTWDLDAEAKQLPLLTAALAALGVEHGIRALAHRQLGHAYEITVGTRRYWFVPVMGTAVLAQYLHIACLLGSQRNILLGIVGGLAPGIRTGDVIIPTAVHGNENARYYDRDNRTGLYLPDAELRANLLAHHGAPALTGTTTTCEMMLAETLADVQAWSTAGYIGVEMEGALTFALSRHFGVPAAALFYVADNLIEAETMLDESYRAHDDLHLRVRRRQYMTGLATLLALPEIPLA